MRAPIRLLAVAGVAALSIVGGCNRPPGPPAPQLEDVTWILAADVLGTPPPAPDGGGGRPITAAFRNESAGPSRDLAAGTVNGSAGCNSYSGRYVRRSGQLSISSVVSTDMACDPNTMRREQAYLVRLQQAQTFRIDGSVLHVRGAAGGGADLLRFTASAPPPPTPGPGPAGASSDSPVTSPGSP